MGKHVLFGDGSDAAAFNCSKRAKESADDGFCVVQPKNNKRVAISAVKPQTEPVKLSFVRDLVLNIFADAPNQRWICVKNKMGVSRVLLILLQNAPLPDDVLADGALLCTQKSAALRAFSVAVRTIGAVERCRVLPAADVLLRCPLAVTRSQQTQALNGPQMRIAELLLSEEALAENNFPLHYEESVSQPNVPFELSQGKESVKMQNNAQISSENGGEEALELLALDCEMVLTTAGSEVARVSLVDAKGVAVYDALVAPANDVVDYLTQFSGITRETLVGVKTTLSDVQREMRRFVTPHTVLVGHSLENDLHALQMAHRLVVDTSVIFRHPQYPQYKHALRHIARKFLNKHIQEAAHDSVEDARTCMELVLAKMRNGPLFGVEQEKVSIGDRLARFSRRLLHVENALEVDAAAVSAHHVIVHTISSSTPGKEALNCALEACAHIQPLLPPQSLTIVVNGQMDATVCEDLFAQKIATWKTDKEQWSDAQEAALQEACLQARSGFCLINLKK